MHGIPMVYTRACTYVCNYAISFRIITITFTDSEWVYYSCLTLQHYQMVIVSPHRHSQGKMCNGSRPQQFASKTRHTSPSTSKLVDTTPQNEAKAVQLHSCNDAMPAVSSLSETAILPPLLLNSGRTSQFGISKKSSCTRTRSQSTVDSTPSSPFSASSTFSDSSAEMVPLPALRQSHIEVFTYALLRKNYKNLKRGETVMISPGGWDTGTNSCTVQSELTGVCESVHPASKFLEVLRPITDEPWVAINPIYVCMTHKDILECVLSRLTYSVIECANYGWLAICCSCIYYDCMSTQLHS